MSQRLGNKLISGIIAERASVNILATITSASGDTYLDENGDTWLKSGLFENDLTVYPNAIPVNTALFGDELVLGLVTPRDIRFSPTGDTLFLLSSFSATATAGEIYEYALTTPYDLTTATLSTMVDTPAAATTLRSLLFSPNGLSLAIYDGFIGIYTATMTTAYDLSTITFSTTVIDIENYNASLTNLDRMEWGPNGLSLSVYVAFVGIFHLSIPIAYDVTSIPATGNLSVSFINLADLPGFVASGFTYNNDFTKIWVEQDDVIYEYDLIQGVDGLEVDGNPISTHRIDLQINGTFDNLTFINDELFIADRNPIAVRQLVLGVAVGTVELIDEVNNTQYLKVT